MSNTAPLSSPPAPCTGSSCTGEPDKIRSRAEAIAGAIGDTIPLPRNASVLDYGCGTAALSMVLAPRVGRVLAVDSSAELLSDVRQKLSAAGVNTIRTQCLDLAKDALPNEHFDLVVSSMALHHIADADAMLTAWVSLLRAGGWLAVADLCSEGGSFHAEMSVPHHGFAPESLAATVQGLGLVQVTWRVVHTMVKNEREYPIFLLTGRRR